MIYCISGNLDDLAFDKAIHYIGWGLDTLQSQSSKVWIWNSPDFLSSIALFQTQCTCHLKSQFLNNSHCLLLPPCCLLQRCSFALSFYLFLYLLSLLFLFGGLPPIFISSTLVDFCLFL